MRVCCTWRGGERPLLLCTAVGRLRGASRSHGAVTQHEPTPVRVRALLRLPCVVCAGPTLVCAAQVPRAGMQRKLGARADGGGRHHHQLQRGPAAQRRQDAGTGLPQAQDGPQAGGALSQAQRCAACERTAHSSAQHSAGLLRCGVWTRHTPAGHVVTRQLRARCCRQGCGSGRVTQHHVARAQRNTSIVAANTAFPA